MRRGNISAALCRAILVIGLLAGTLFGVWVGLEGKAFLACIAMSLVFTWSLSMLVGITLEEWEYAPLGNRSKTGTGSSPPEMPSA